MVPDLPLEALEEILLQRLKIALVQYCVRLHAMVAKAALATSEMMQPMQLVVQVAMLGVTIAMTQMKQVQKF